MLVFPRRVICSVRFDLPGRKFISVSTSYLTSLVMFKIVVQLVITATLILLVIWTLYNRNAIFLAYSCFLPNFHWKSVYTLQHVCICMCFIHLKSYSENPDKLQWKIISFHICKTNVSRVYNDSGLEEFCTWWHFELGLFFNAFCRSQNLFYMCDAFVHLMFDYTSCTGQSASLIKLIVIR